MQVDPASPAADHGEFSELEIGDPDQQRLRAQARDYFEQLMSAELSVRLRAEDESHDNSTPATSVRRSIGRQIGGDGWIAIGAPLEHGGTPGSFTDRIIVVQEAERAGAPFPFLTTLSILPALARFGTEDQRSDLIPRMISGDLLMALGYTEPDAGTDLASLRTRAVARDGGFVINGSKVFTSEADIADYIVVAARTDTEVPATNGISLFLVPTSAEGFGVTPLPTVGDYRTTTTYYDDVFAAPEQLLGPLNGGWHVMMSQLNLERIAMAVRITTAASLVEDVRAALRTLRDVDSRPMLSDPAVQRQLAEAAIESIGARALIRHHIGDGHSSSAQAASAMKVFASESAIRSTRALMQALGPIGALTPDEATAPLHGRLERTYRRALIDTFGGGANEIQREVIAGRALGLPRSR